MGRQQWKDVRKVGWKIVDWLNPAQDRDKLGAFVSEVINPRVPLQAGDFLTS